MPNPLNLQTNAILASLSGPSAALHRNQTVQLACATMPRTSSRRLRHLAAALGAPPPSVASAAAEGPGMTVTKVGIIMNGVTGRMGTNQHLLRSLVPIIEEGGLPISGTEVLVPDLCLVGRNPAKLAALVRPPPHTHTLPHSPSPRAAPEAGLAGCRAHARCGGAPVGAVGR